MSDLLLCPLSDIIELVGHRRSTAAASEWSFRKRLVSAQIAYVIVGHIY